MDWKTVVPKPISVAIGAFGLSRPVLIQLLARIHADIARDYPQFRKFRVRDAEENYRYRIVIAENGQRHLFTFAINDSAQGFLIVTDISHFAR